MTYRLHWSLAICIMKSLKAVKALLVEIIIILCYIYLYLSRQVTGTVVSSQAMLRKMVFHFFMSVESTGWSSWTLKPKIIGSQVRWNYHFTVLESVDFCEENKGFIVIGGTFYFNGALIPKTLYSFNAIGHYFHIPTRLLFFLENQRFKNKVIDYARHYQKLIRSNNINEGGMKTKKTFRETKGSNIQVFWIASVVREQGTLWLFCDESRDAKSSRGWGIVKTWE